MIHRRFFRYKYPFPDKDALTDTFGRLDFDVKDWVIAFNVKLDKIDLEPGSEEDQQVRIAIQQPGDFSLQSLFLTFNCE